MAFKVDVVSDIVCPWCYLGKRRLDKAMRHVSGPSLVRWHPMQLYPDVPESGTEAGRFMDERFGDAARVRSAMDQLAAAGRELGIRFDFDRIQRIPNTLDAHRLIAGASDRQDALVENLFSGFFEQGLDIADADTLSSLAVAAGLSRQRVTDILDDARTREAVLKEQARMKKLGLAGIPNFLLNGRLAVSGAQDEATLVKAFDMALFGAPAKDSPPPVLH